jgi:hypothetical protein
MTTKKSLPIRKLKAALWKELSEASCDPRVSRETIVSIAKRNCRKLNAARAKAKAKRDAAKAKRR